jgi:hypothetical protein
MSRIFSTSEASEILASAELDDEPVYREKTGLAIEPPTEDAMKPTWLEARFGEVVHQDDEKKRISGSFVCLLFVVYFVQGALELAYATLLLPVACMCDTCMTQLYSFLGASQFSST